MARRPLRHERAPQEHERLRDAPVILDALPQVQEAVLRFRDDDASRFLDGHTLTLPTGAGRSGGGLGFGCALKRMSVNMRA